MGERIEIKDMIKITIDFYPSSSPKKPVTIAEAEIRSTGKGTKTLSNYSYHLHTNKKPYCASGRLMGFKRKGYNVWALLFYILWDAVVIKKPSVVKNSKRRKRNE
jgi:hypothetical protein